MDATGPLGTASQGAGGSVIGSLLVLVLVLAAIPLCLWLVRRATQIGGASRGSMALHSSLNVGPRERVAVVQVGGRWLVVGITGASMNLLAELDGPPPPTSVAPASAASAHGSDKSFLKRLSGLGLVLLLVSGFAMGPDTAFAQSLLSVQQSSGAQGTTWSVPIQTLLFFTALSFLPAVLLLMTSFTRIVIVLSLVRQALGMQSAPPNQVLIGMALFLTAFVMSPTLDRVYQDAYAPYTENRISFDQALTAGTAPMRQFMLRQTRAEDLALFTRMARKPVDGPQAVTADNAPMTLVVPAFVISELKTAFQIGFMVFIPFILIDLIVASVLMSLGMMMVSPVLVALPFKMILFVLADGWSLLVSSLVLSFGS